MQKTHKEVNSTDLLVNLKKSSTKGVAKLLANLKTRFLQNNPDWQDKEITI